jgi:hypothetical protein
MSKRPGVQLVAIDVEVTGHPAGGDRCRSDRVTSWWRSMSKRPGVQLVAIDVEATG